MCIDGIVYFVADYPTRVPGSCATNGNQSFDCGNGKCIPFTSVRNCIKDCSDGSDEGENSLAKLIMIILESVHEKYIVKEICYSLWF